MARMLSDEIFKSDRLGLLFVGRSKEFKPLSIEDDTRKSMISKAVSCCPLDVLCDKLGLEDN